VLRQHFRGWLIETASPAFEPGTVTFLDFRTSQKNEMRFFYVLPLSARQALVEYVLFNPERCTQAIRAYLEGVLGLRDYRVIGEEAGVNLLTDRPFARRLGRHVMAIGVRGGRVKPSSGYAFTRIQDDSRAIVRSLVGHGHPFHVPDGPRLFRWCDSLMLHVMQHEGGRSAAIYSELFRSNPVERVFRFLDEASTPLENAAVIASLPPRPFLAALLRMLLRRLTPAAGQHDEK
jgi:lycopene beta-cyclase